MAEFESGDDREETNNIPDKMVEENKEQGDDLENNQVEEAPELNVKEGYEEDLQILTSSPTV